MSEIMLEGGVNFRDMGGYATDDGRAVRYGVLFRSGKLSGLTENDLAALQKFSIKVVLDYRDEDETQKAPDRLWEGAVRFSCPALPPQLRSEGLSADLNKLVRALSEGTTAPNRSSAQIMEQLYRELPFDNTAYRRLFEHLADCSPQNGILQHCTAGKDRTGVGSALTLLALGVPANSVKQDYLDTEKILHPHRPDILAGMLKLGDGQAPSPEIVAALSPLLEARESYLDSALNAVLERYGTFEDYFEQELGLGAERRKKLQERYLVPSSS